MHSRRFRAQLAMRILRDPRTLHVPPGHPYSPIPSPDDVDRAQRRAMAAARQLPGIDLREDEQLALLERMLPLYEDLPFGGDPGPRRFGYDNTWFTYADALGYALMLRHLRPRRVVEVGCGHSSALALDVDELFLGGSTSFTFVEPDATRLREITRPGDLEERLVESIVQDVPLSTFAGLAAGDILFIDSSHVLKAGSDVQYLLDEVLPSLADGVYIHLHDVFYPFEYPGAWLAGGTSLNEAYAVRALLQFSNAYDIALFVPYLRAFHRDWLQEHMPLMLTEPMPTGGIWLRRTRSGGPAS